MSSIRASRVDREPEALARARATRCSAPREVEEHAAVRRLVAEDDVLGDRHHRDQHEVLVHHADPRAIASFGEPRTDRLALAAGSRPRRAGRARRGCSSASTCRRRSRRAGRGPRPAQVEARCRRSRRPREALRDLPQLEDAGSLGHPEIIVPSRERVRRASCAVRGVRGGRGREIDVDVGDPLPGALRPKRGGRARRPARRVLPLSPSYFGPAP